MYKEEISLH
jgi:hypothetical protein